MEAGLKVMVNAKLKTESKVMNTSKIYIDKTNLQLYHMPPLLRPCPQHILESYTDVIKKNKL